MRQTHINKHIIAIKTEKTQEQCFQRQFYDWCCQSSAAPLCKSPSTHRATTPSHQVRSSDVFRSWPDAWNSLSDYLRDPSLSEDTIRRSLKTYLFALY